MELDDTIRPLPCILLPPQRVYAAVHTCDGEGQEWKGVGEGGRELATFFIDSNLKSCRWGKHAR